MKSIPNIVVQLIHMHGGLKGQIQEYGEPVITIGRFPTSTLTFPPEEPGVSREHAKIVREGNQFRLIALKDTYGTCVNGKQVREALLRNGDVIEFGSGGPKVSFNTEIREGSAAGYGQAPPPSEPPPYRPAAPPSPPPLRTPPREVPAVSGAAAFTGARPGYHPAEEGRPAVAHAEPFPGRAVQPERTDIPVQRVSAPLVIQFGPTIRTYRELPIVIGSGGRADFVLQHPGILEQHAQLLYHQESYWIKELTGQRHLTVNGRPLDGPVRLNQSDEIMFSRQGPRFRFLGDGRLAEVELESYDDRAASVRNSPGDGALNHAREVPPQEGVLSRFIKGFR